MYSNNTLLVLTRKILIMLRQLLPPPLTMIMVFIFMKQWKLTVTILLHFR